MSSSMKEYLASKYMSGPKADAILSRSSTSQPLKKKKKRKIGAGEPSTSTSTSSSYIRDEDGGWGAADANGAEEEEEVVVASDRSFKKRGAAGGEGEGEGWTTIRAPTPPPPPADEDPLVVAVEQDAAPMTGLVRSSQLRKVAKLGKAKKEEVVPTEQEMETVYRDTSGRKIDTKAERAEAARKKREWEEKQAEKMEWGKGLVQREEKERQRLEAEKEKSRPMARFVDDAELNEDQKAQDRWNDPAAAFLSKKRSKGPRKPEYHGPPPPPNRFGIKPGYRWDGVDRSNGFEKKYFQRINERKRRDLEAYEWRVDDM
ncbi:hypothetical protein BOTBODRAFT_37809 [Botryobasidium botryosum FD-172 SS1]|uniref:Pre-mRNA-splicing factor CWC26 n=1 Tax=Botryobasidium botryosum (strain FD-172 SS1) TaxID=930990 RepID=A0A067LZ05_BOTB1|nr:hypothetical protein BOTBODRAFT_37809 [Botryobasidium botryosum FD-172 SS1]